MHYNLLQKGLKPEADQDDADVGLRPCAVRQCHHGQSGLRQGQPEGGRRLCARHDQGRARHHQGPGYGDQVGDEAQRYRRCEDRARPPQDGAARQLRHALGEGERLRRCRHGASGEIDRPDCVDL